jgi:hypothetical protein
MDDQSPSDSLDATLERAMDWLEELPTSWLSRELADEGLAGALAWVAEINDRWAAERGALGADVLAKLRQWLKRFLDTSRELSDAAGARSVSVAVGIAHLEVTVTFGQSGA